MEEEGEDLRTMDQMLLMGSDWAAEVAWAAAMGLSAMAPPAQLYCQKAELPCHLPATTQAL